jgi:hypothetical protein
MARSLPREQAVGGKYGNSSVVSKLDVIERHLAKIEKLLTALLENKIDDKKEKTS